MKDLIQNDFWAVLGAAEDAYWKAQEQLNEVESEYHGEVYAFGDAGAGSFDGVARYREEVRLLKASYESLLAQFGEAA